MAFMLRVKLKRWRCSKDLLPYQGPYHLNVRTWGRATRRAKRNFESIKYSLLSTLPINKPLEPASLVTTKVSLFPRSLDCVYSNQAPAPQFIILKIARASFHSQCTQLPHNKVKRQVTKNICKSKGMLYHHSPTDTERIVSTNGANRSYSM